jgi:ketosteroid isomerase-like protein
MTRKSGIARTKSISNVANNQAVSWTIGSKPNANSHVGCFAGAGGLENRPATHGDPGREVTNGHGAIPLAADCGRENSVAMISKEEVQASYEEFLQALKSGDTSSLERMYADDYMLVRPNGDILTKELILADLRQHSMRFTSFDVDDVLIRTKGSVGILTAVVRSTAVRDGVEIRTHARQVAILSKENGRITISHFQSTNVVGR